MLALGIAVWMTRACATRIPVLVLTIISLDLLQAFVYIACLLFVMWFAVAFVDFMFDLIYAGIPFTRHDPLPLVSFPLRGTFPGDPIDWTPEVRLRAGHSIQRGSALYHVDHHSFYGDGLHPITSD